jgi:hypothetical protein
MNWGILCDRHLSQIRITVDKTTLTTISQLRVAVQESPRQRRIELEVQVALCKQRPYIIDNTAISINTSHFYWIDTPHPMSTVTTKGMNKFTQLLDLRQVTHCIAIAALSSTHKPVSPCE